MIYKMGLQNKYYKLVDQGNKIVELRLYDQKRKKLKVGNLIRFYEEPERINYIDTIITKLNKYNSFSEALENINMNLLTNESEEKYLADLENYYKKEEQATTNGLTVTQTYWYLGDNNINETNFGEGAKALYSGKDYWVASRIVNCIERGARFWL